MWVEGEVGPHQKLIIYFIKTKAISRQINFKHLAFDYLLAVGTPAAASVLRGLKYMYFISDDLLFFKSKCRLFYMFLYFFIVSQSISIVFLNCRWNLQENWPRLCLMWTLKLANRGPQQCLKGSLTQNILAFFIIFNIKSVFF